MCTLARDNSVIPGVAFPSARTPIKEVPGFARLDFRPWITCCSKSSEIGFWSYPLRRISVPPEPIIRYRRYLFNGVPPQPNCPSVNVPFRVRIVITEGWCLTFDSPIPESMGYNVSHLLCATIITIQPQTAVKLHGVFASRWKSLAYSPKL